MWDLTQNACSAELVPDGAKAIRSVSISRDASLLAAANDAGSCFVWRLGRNEDSSTKFEPLQKLQAHSTYVTKCLMSPDGKRLATCSADQSARLPLPAARRQPSEPAPPGLPAGQDLGHPEQLCVRQDAQRPPALGVGRRVLGGLGLPRDGLVGPDRQAVGRGVGRDHPALHRPPQGRDSRGTA